MPEEAIILAGGLGTRLRSVVDDVPKSMAPINGRPFLEYQLDYILSRGIRRCILSVGYKAESVSGYFGERYKSCDLLYAREDHPLGTGGAVKNALKHVESSDVLVLNGDSLFAVDIPALFAFHRSRNADGSLALREMEHIRRYGSVELDARQRIRSFREKMPLERGLINGGMYVLNTGSFQALDLPDVFSLERDFFEAYVESLQLFGFRSSGYFLDIGIPDDYARAQAEFVKQPWNRPS